MNARKIRGNLPLVMLLVLVAVSMIAGSAAAQFDEDDDKRIKPPDEGGNVPGDQGGGDPDNPVPLISSGDLIMDDMEYDYCSVYVSASAGVLTKEDFFRMMMTLSGIVGKVLIF